MARPTIEESEYKEEIRKLQKKEDELNEKIKSLGNEVEIKVQKILNNPNNLVISDINRIELLKNKLKEMVYSINMIEETIFGDEELNKSRLGFEFGRIFSSVKDLALLLNFKFEEKEEPNNNKKVEKIEKIERPISNRVNV
jgi:hypothetical protein